MLAVEEDDMVALLWLLAWKMTGLSWVLGPGPGAARARDGAMCTCVRVRGVAWVRVGRGDGQSGHTCFVRQSYHLSSSQHGRIASFFVGAAVNGSTY